MNLIAVSHEMNFAEVFQKMRSMVESMLSSADWANRDLRVFILLQHLLLEIKQNEQRFRLNMEILRDLCQDAERVMKDSPHGKEG